MFLCSSRTFRMFDPFCTSDVCTTYCSNGHFVPWAINTRSNPLVRVEHFTPITHKNTSAPSHSLLHQILDLGEILESSYQIFHLVIDPVLPYLSTKVNHVWSKS